jgi:hypothetical protein
MAFAAEVKHGHIDLSVDVYSISQNLIECPIMMDEDVPQILIDEG